MNGSAGARSCLVTIQSRTAGKGPSGFPTETFTDLGAVWMSKEDALRWDGGGERFKADQFSARAYDIWVMPFQSNMDPESVDVPATRRLSYGSRVYDIIQASLGDRKEIKLVTLAKVG